MATTTRGAAELCDPPSDPDGSLDGWISFLSRASNRGHMGNRLYVGNLSFQTSSESIQDAFAACGEVSEVHIVQDRDSGQSRGFAFVTMGSPAEAAKAISTLDGSSLDGRSLRVNEAEERQSRGGGGGGGGGGRSSGGGGGGGRSGGGGGGRW
jgi:RNA recognition motif-containing protein